MCGRSLSNCPKVSKGPKVSDDFEDSIGLDISDSPEVSDGLKLSDGPEFSDSFEDYLNSELFSTF